MSATTRRKLEELHLCQCLSQLSLLLTRDLKEAFLQVQQLGGISLAQPQEATSLDLLPEASLLHQVLFLHQPQQLADTPHPATDLGSPLLLKPQNPVSHQAQRVFPATECQLPLLQWPKIRMMKMTNS